MIETGLVNLLTGDSSITDLIGTRVYYKDLPENPKIPYAIFFIVTGQSEFTLDGPDPLTARRYQFSAFDREAFGARKIIQAIKKVVEGYSGTLSDGTQVQSIIQQDDGDIAREVGTGGFISGAYVDVEIAFIQQ